MLELSLLNAYLKFTRTHGLPPLDTFKTRSIILRHLAGDTFKRVETVTDIVHIPGQDEAAPLYGEPAFIHYRTCFREEPTNWSELNRTFLQRVVITNEDIVEQYIETVYGKFRGAEFSIPIEVIQEKLFEAEDLARAQNDMNL